MQKSLQRNMVKSGQWTNKMSVNPTLSFAHLSRSLNLCLYLYPPPTQAPSIHSELGAEHPKSISTLLQDFYDSVLLALWVPTGWLVFL